MYGPAARCKRASSTLAGHGWAIDLDLEKFFDRVNHDKLMGQIAKRVEDATAQ
jgi:retron-type reverse transcriptase